MKSDSFISLVLTTYSFEDDIIHELNNIYLELDNHYTDYEILIVSRGGFTNIKHQSKIDDALVKIPSLRFLQLSSYVHDDVAWAAGLENAIGDFVLLYDYHSDPISIINESIEICKNGFDVVVGVSDRHLPLQYRLLRDFGSRILAAIDYHIPKNATSFRCLSRRAVNAVTETGRFHHQFYLRIQKTGYPANNLVYRPNDTGNDKKSVIYGFRHLVRLLIFNSSRPLRWMSVLGTVGSLSAFIFAVYSILVNLVNGHVVEGWTTTILFMSTLFMLQFIMLAFFGEYLSRLLDERNLQADYSVVFEKNSTIMINQDRVNVLYDSITVDDNKVQTGRDR